MKITKRLSVQIAAAIAVATLVGPSAFAESRHHQATGHQGESRNSHNSGESSRSSGQRGSARDNVQRDRSSSYQRDNVQRDRSSSYQRDNAQRDRSSSYQRDNAQRDRTASRNDQRGWRDTSRQRSGESNSYNRNRNSYGRGGVRNYGYRGDFGRNFRGGERFRGAGYVRNIVRERNGYRVWLDGGPFPFFVPFARWALFPLRIGLSVRFGGYYDRLGYVSVYDVGYDDGYRDGYGYAGVDGYGYGSGYGSGPVAETSGHLRGIVESVDYNRGTLAVRDDVSREIVNVTMPRDRRIEDVRQGDQVEFSGNWVRGVFEAYRLDADRYDADRFREDGTRY